MLMVNQLIGFGVGDSGPVQTWQTAASATLTEDVYAGFTGYAIRCTIPITVSGSKIRITFVGPATAANVFGVDNVFVGHYAGSGDAYDAETSPTALTRVTFSGGNTFALTTGQEILSDEITFAANSAKTLLVNYDIQDAGTTRIRGLTTNSGWETYSKTGVNEAGTANVTGYGAGPDAAGIRLIEVFG